MDGGERLMPSLNAEIAPDNPPAHLPPTLLGSSSVFLALYRALGVCVLLLLWKGHCGSNRPISALSSYVPYRTPSNIYIRKRMKQLTILGRRHRRHDGRHLAIPARHPQDSPTILRRLLGIRRLSRRLQWSGLGSSGLRARSCFVLHELRGDKEISCPIQAECFE